MIETTKKLVSWPSDELGALLGGAEKQRDLTTEDVQALLRLGPVRFVVANIGQPLRFVAPEDCFTFWKEEVRQRVVDTDGLFYLDDFEGGCCYHASAWDDGGDSALVVLVMSH